MPSVQSSTDSAVVLAFIAFVGISITVAAAIIIGVVLLFGTL
jgi:hypothetical protein